MKRQAHFLYWVAWTFVMGAFIPLHLLFLLLALFATLLPLTPTQVAAENLKKRLGASRGKAFLFTCRMYFSYYIYFFESFVLRPLGLVCVLRQCDFEEYVLAVRAQYEVPKSVGNMLLSGHFGNIEVVGEAVARSLQRAHANSYVALAKPSALRIFTILLARMRKSRGIKQLLTDRKDLLRAMMACAKKGDSLGFLVDQKPTADGIFVEFFGLWAAFPYAGPDVALKFGQPVFHMAVVRRLPGYFHLEFAEGDNSHLKVASWAPDVITQKATPYSPNAVFEDASATKKVRMAPVMASYAGWLEALVRAHPSQWFWDYRKWSRQPKAT
jgi:lauroyl/myristoyl acyltransferase